MQYHNDLDTRLMMQVRQGSHESFALLLQRHRAGIVHFLFRMTHDDAISEELAQDVFVRVYRRRQAYQPTAKFTTWLYRIATNAAFNYKRDHWYQSLCYSLDQQPQDRLKLQVPDHRLSIEEMKLRESSVNEIRSAIAALPDRQRACVLLHKYEEMEYSDIASALDCSVPAVKSLLFRAYETLRARLAHFSTTRPSTTNALQNEYRPNCARILARSAAA